MTDKPAKLRGPQLTVTVSERKQIIARMKAKALEGDSMAANAVALFELAPAIKTLSTAK